MYYYWYIFIIIFIHCTYINTSTANNNYINYNSIHITADIKV